MGLRPQGDLGWGVQLKLDFPESQPTGLPTQDCGTGGGGGGGWSKTVGEATPKQTL